MLLKQGKTFERTIHLTFVPGTLPYQVMLSMLRFLAVSHSNIAVTFLLLDEEIGGHEGMELFVKTALFKELNIGTSSLLLVGQLCSWWLM